MQKTVASWRDLGSSPQASHSTTGIGRDIAPIPCHSHNDYSHSIPLYEALAAGCTGVEADVWLTNHDLLVGHSKSSLTPARSLKTLYVDPLVSILRHQNPNMSDSHPINNSDVNGIFETSPASTLTLLIDIKSAGADTLSIVLQQLEPLRSRGWLTHFDGTKVVPGPVTVVGTGNTPFDLIVSNTTYRDIFFDAPLDQLGGETSPYNTTNSYYASVSFSKAIGQLSHGRLSPQQVETVKRQVGAAAAKGLKARYWDTPAKPIGVRDYVWDILVEEGVGMLNVDDVSAARRRAW